MFGGVGWWEEFEVVLDKFGLKGDLRDMPGSMGMWKEGIKAKVVEDWWSELGERSSLEWYKKVKEDFDIEEYVKVLDNYEVRLRFRLRTWSAGLLVDKKVWYV